MVRNRSGVKKALSVFSPTAKKVVDDPTDVASAQPQTPHEIDPSTPYENDAAPTALEFALLSMRVENLERIVAALLEKADVDVQIALSVCPVTGE